MQSGMPADLPADTDDQRSRKTSLRLARRVSRHQPMLRDEWWLGGCSSSGHCGRALLLTAENHLDLPRLPAASTVVRYVQLVREAAVVGHEVVLPDRHAWRLGADCDVAPTDLDGAGGRVDLLAQEGPRDVQILDDPRFPVRVVLPQADP